MEDQAIPVADPRQCTLVFIACGYEEQRHDKACVFTWKSPRTYLGQLIKETNPYRWCITKLIILGVAALLKPEKKKIFSFFKQ